LINISIKVERKCQLCPQKIEEMSTCYHCGDQCREELNYDSHVFCCTGCKTVYEILNATEMNKYYSLDDNPGIRPSSAVKGKYNFLDLEEFKQKLVFFEEGSVLKVSFFLPQIHCSSCLWLLERLHNLNPGVIQSQLDFAKKIAVITFDTQVISLRELAELLATIGYPPKITLEDYEGKPAKSTNKRLLLQIGVAGFCFGNIMLLSFPDYLGLNANDANFQRLFGILNLVLAMPVLLFGASDYLISGFKALRAKTINIDVPLSLGIIALFLQSLYEIITHSGAGYMDSFAGLIFYLLIGKWFQQQTYSAINFERDYESYFPISVAKVENGQEEIVALKSVKVGDRLIIRNNELIPTDAVLMKGNGSVDYSFVTGESALIEKKEGDKLFAGGRQEGTSIEIEVLKDVKNSYLTQLWNNPIFDKEKVTVSLSDRISQYFTLLIIGIALISGVVWYYIDSSNSIFVISSILIVACPCAIALSVPFTYGNSMRILGRKSLYLRTTRVIEPIDAITCVVFDKTGTITQNEEAAMRWQGRPFSNQEECEIAAVVKDSAHPLSRKIAAFLTGDKGIVSTYMEEIMGKGIRATVQGNEYLIGSASFTSTVATDNQTRVYITKNGEGIGSFVFSNTYRSGMADLFKTLAKTKKIHILSGDNNAELEALKAITPVGTIINFNQTPEDKLQYIAQLQAQGEKVMMLGDGLNDAGALKKSDVGVSVVDDIYAFSPASDAIIAGDKLTQLANYMDYAKFSKNVVKLSYIFSLLYNTIGLYFAISGTLTPLVAAILMPVSSITVVVFVTLMTNVKGKSLV
jgi:Cu+-exporting ATPase